MLSPINAVPAVPASGGAVPSTATLPVIAGPHVAAVDRASAGTVAAHVVVAGSPMTTAENALNCAVVIASQVAGVATVTVSPAGTALASALAVPPFTVVDKISTEPDRQQGRREPGHYAPADPGLRAALAGIKPAYFSSGLSRTAAAARIFALKKAKNCPA